MKVQLKKSQIIADIENGMTRVELANKYGISAGQIKKALTAMGIADMKAKQVKFEIVDEEDESSVGVHDISPAPDFVPFPDVAPVSFGTGNGLPVNNNF